MAEVKEQIIKSIQQAASSIGAEAQFIPLLDKPRDEKFGDWTSNAAMVLAKELKQPPRKIAEQLVSNLPIDSSIIEKVEIAGAGFINFFVSSDSYKKNFLNILKKADDYGRVKSTGKRVLLEWVSANPTGPLHAGHGRHVCLGKAVANLCDWNGYKVTREYYYNDAGNQMNNLALSVKARYMQILDENYPFPENGYVGEYVKTIGQLLYEEYGDKLKDTKNDDIFKEAGEKYNFKMIRHTLERLGISHDEYFNETSLYEKGNIKELLALFKKKGISYEKEGAVWLKMDNEPGFEKDKVIVKSTGEPTYRLPDMAYHITKVKRGYDLIIDIFGADHGDTYKEVLYGVRQAGFETSHIKVIIHQMVTFKSGDESVKMSKRSDNVYYLNDLIEDVGADAAQFFFVMRAANTHLDFDIQLAKDQSDKNPVYYLQYAHARICGILRNADDHMPDYKHVPLEELDLSLIQTPEEIRVCKSLAEFPDVVIQSGETLEPHKIITYLNQLAGDFHAFYHNNRVIDMDNVQLSVMRLHLCLAVKQVLQNGFEIIGIGAPERM